MNSFFWILGFLWALCPSAGADDYMAVRISTGRTGNVTVSNSTVAVPSSRLPCRMVINYANNSSSDTVYRMAVVSNTVSSIAREGFPMDPGEKISISVNPLPPYVTFYFLAETGSTGVDLRYEELGCRSLPNP